MTSFKDWNIEKNTIISSDVNTQTHVHTQILNFKLETTTLEAKLYLLTIVFKSVKRMVLACSSHYRETWNKMVFEIFFAYFWFHKWEETKLV